MTNIIELISQPWHWSISGAMIALVMFLLLYFGGEFGVSGNLRTLCAIGGAGKKISFFNFNWRNQIWNLVFIFGAIGGGFIASQYLASDMPVQIAEATRDHLASEGIATPVTLEDGTGYVPMEIFAKEKILTLRSLIFIVLGGLMIGFGTRWAGGCTSGHAISGLSNLQLPSLIAVVGFFIGGLIMTHFLLPFLFSL
ncbi:MAG: YeeE/YedE family protein [Saprospiraceae bacterium]|nr:YeeE/YedE family protein [Saprospiraceae bacterium]